MDEMSTELASTDILGKRKRSSEPDYNDNSSKHGASVGVLELSDDDDDKYIKLEDNEDGAFLPDDLDGDIDEADGIGMDDADLDVYKETMEQFPEVPAYDTDIPRIRKDLTDIVKGIHEILIHKPSNNIHINRFQETSSGLLQIPAPPIFKIALLGDAGTGKSSLLNSLIDCPDLARALAGGESCTSVPCEYTGALPGQNKKFAAEVTYFDMSAVKDLLKEHLDAYHLYVFNFDKEWEQELQLQYKRRSDTALKTFRSIFRKRAEFSSDEAAQNYLKSNRMKTKKVLEVMHIWCKAIYEGVLGSDDELVLRPAADTKDDFRKLIDPMVNPTTNNDQPALWPLVKFVRIGVQGSRILNNVTLADLPGISDTNQVKVDATNDYLRQCHGLWIVARMDRVVSDTTVDSLVARFGERFADNIAVIATRSDDNVTPGLATYLKDEAGMALEGFDKLSEKSQQIQLRVSHARRTLGSRMKAKPSRERTLKVRKVKAQLDKAVDEKTEIDNERFCLLVEARNELNTRRVKQEMKGHLARKQKLPVFCVSNHHYLVLKGAAEPESFQLPAAQTGIPALRHHTLEMAAYGLQQVLDDCIRHHLHVYLRGVWLWVMSQYVESANDLKELVEAPQRGLDDKVSLYLGELKDDIDTNITEQLLSSSSQCSKTAIAHFENKRRDKHWATILAFMRKNGNHHTSACPKESWNEQWLEGFSRIVRQHWAEAKSSQEGKLDEQMDLLINEVSSVVPKIRQRRSGSKLELDGFQHMIEGSIVGIKNAVRDHQARFKLELSNIKTDATQDRHTGYFTKAMKNTYERCKDERGTGCVARSTGHITEALNASSTSSPFDEAANAIAEAINENAKTQASVLQEEVTAILEDIYAYFDGMITEGVLDPNEHDVRMKLQPFLEKAIVDFKQLQEDLDGIKAEYVAKAAEAAKQAKQVKGKGVRQSAQARNKAVEKETEKAMSMKADKDDEGVIGNVCIKVEKA